MLQVTWCKNYNESTSTEELLKKASITLGKAVVTYKIDKSAVGNRPSMNWLLLWISHDGLTENPKDTICSVQMLLNGNAAQRAANPPPLRRRNGPPPLKRAERKTGGREGRACGSPLQRLCRTLGKTSPKRFSPSILFLRLQETHRLQRRRGSPQGNPSRPPRGQIHSKANARHLASIGR